MEGTSASKSIDQVEEWTDMMINGSERDYPSKQSMLEEILQCHTVQLPIKTKNAGRDLSKGFTENTY